MAFLNLVTHLQLTLVCKKYDVRFRWIFTSFDGGKHPPGVKKSCLDGLLLMEEKNLNLHNGVPTLSCPVTIEVLLTPLGVSNKPAFNSRSKKTAPSIMERLSYLKQNLTNDPHSLTPLYYHWRQFPPAGFSGKTSCHSVGDSLPRRPDDYQSW